MIYPKDIDENKRQRLKLIQKAEEDYDLRELVKQECKYDPLYFFNMLAWTYNPRIEPYNFPFVTYEFQDQFIRDIVNCIENERDSCTEKSRDMGFSWQLVGIHVWAFLFKGWSSLYGSYKEDYVDTQGNMDSFFERVRYFLYKLPKWILPGDLQDKYMNISSKSLGAEIAGDSGQNFGTGGRRKFITLDEFALWQHDEKAFRKTRDISNCRIIGGTPEGKNNVYGKIMTNHKDYEHLQIKKIRLHWKMHPNKTQEWYENEKANRTPLDVAKELDISYDTSVTGAVYKSFLQVSNFGRYEYDPSLATYTSWDFGRDTTAIIWIQYDPKTDSHFIIDSYSKSKLDDPNISIEFFRPFVTGELENFLYSQEELDKINLHSKWRYSGHIGDPYNLNSKTINAVSSIADKLREKNIHVTSRNDTKVHERITKTELFLNKLYVDDNQYRFIDAITQSRYPEKKDNSQSTKESRIPVHDDNSHFRTALEYYVDNAPKQRKTRIPIQRKRSSLYNKII